MMDRCWSIRFPYRFKGRLAIRGEDPDSKPDEKTDRKAGDVWIGYQKNQDVWIHVAIEAPSQQAAQEDKEQNYEEYQEKADLFVRKEFPDQEIIWPPGTK